MKYRLDFVTNSSSSSFIVAKVKNPLLAKLFIQYKDAANSVLKVNKYNINNDIIEIESRDFISMPLVRNITGVIESFICVFEEYLEYTEEDLELCYNNDKFKDCIPEYEKRVKDLKGLLQALKVTKNQMIRHTEYVDWVYGNFERDGECTLKYHLENYSSVHLHEMLKRIAKKYKCKVNEVTEEMIRNYIWDKSFTQEIHFIFDREKKINKYTYTTRFGR